MRLQQTSELVTAKIWISIESSTGQQQRRPVEGVCVCVPFGPYCSVVWVGVMKSVSLPLCPLTINPVTVGADDLWTLGQFRCFYTRQPELTLHCLTLLDVVLPPTANISVLSCRLHNFLTELHTAFKANRFSSDICQSVQSQRSAKKCLSFGSSILDGVKPGTW